MLFLVYNHPDTTAQVFDAIRKAQPPRLYVAADGPRTRREGEAERIAKVREIATAVGWPCEVKTLFRDENLGFKSAVSGGISWFFKHKLLYERNWDKQRIIDLFSIIDWMMRLPAELQRALWQDLEELERNRRMPYITSVERIGMEKGIQKGIQKGIRQGIRRGRQLGVADMLLHLIERRFGPPSDVVRERIIQADPNMLMQWSERILDAQNLDDLWR